jgi:hypothetical protein
MCSVLYVNEWGFARNNLAAFFSLAYTMYVGVAAWLQPPNLNFKKQAFVVVII